MAIIMFENSRYPIAPITPNGVDKRYSIAAINELVATLTDDKTTSTKYKYGNGNHIIKNKSRKTWDSF